jgi:regulator of sigma E protease
MQILSTIFYFIITIGVLVLVHEFGHFIAAISLGMRADVFAVGMGSRLFGWNKTTGFSFGTLRSDVDLEGNTDYRVSLFPIGGYVKIAGMIDESMDTEFLKHEPQPWEFRSKPIWKRAVVLSAGVIMNVILAVAIFWGIIYHQGKDIRPVTEIGYVAPGSPAEKFGLRVSDKILALNDKPVKQWDEIESLLYTESVGSDLTFHIERSGTPVIIFIKRTSVPDLTEQRFGILPTGLVPVVAAVDAGKPAGMIGLQPNDTILGVNDAPVSYGSLSELIKAHADKEMMLVWKRGDQRMEKKVTPTHEGRIGISLEAGYTGTVLHLQYGFFEALPVGIKEVTLTSQLFLDNIYQIIAGRASFSKSLGGPVKIAQMASRSAENGLTAFLGFLAILSISLALLNILPFPALDGGHLVFLAYEGIFRKQIPDKIKIGIQSVGFFLLLAFMAFVVYNDVVNF